MKTKTLAAFASIIIGTSAPVFAGTTYQATGPILELTESKIIIQKDNEKWEIARTPGTKVSGNLKVGAKVTIHYTMTATSVEVKPVKGAAPAAPSAPGTPTGFSTE